MMLRALIDYYDRLAQDREAAVPQFGFSYEKIHFAVVLNADGTLRGGRLDDLRESVPLRAKGKPDGKGQKERIVPRMLIVPDRGGRSGTLIKSFFTWDNTGYALGRDGKKDAGRTAGAFAAFRELHLALQKEIDDDDFRVLCRFLEKWQPEQAEELENWEEASGLNLVFRVHRASPPRFVHESDAVRRAWLRFVAQKQDSVRGRSLISGEEDDIARLHPLIGGVAGANTMGAAIVAFNLDAFESYGKSQSFNAPVSVNEAFRYTTALNRLLDDPLRRLRIGDATVVFWSDRPWSDRPTPFESIFGAALNEEAEDAAVNQQVQTFLQAVQQGHAHAGLAEGGVPFYILGLAPNASRLNVRFWLAGTVRDFAERLAQHVADLEMIGAREGDPPLIVRRLLFETAREPKDIPKQLAGEVARAVLSGGRYPQSLFGAVIGRIRADGAINHRRAAILKAVLVRNARLSRKPMEVSMSLDLDCTEPAYLLGRLFAVLENVQIASRRSKGRTSSNGEGDKSPQERPERDEEAVRRTIRDGFFSAAAATPAAVFPRLLQLHQHHLRKLASSRTRLQAARDRLAREIIDKLGNEFPRHLPLHRQGMFYIGYYQQRQAFFAKRATGTSAAESESAPAPAEA